MAIVAARNTIFVRHLSPQVSESVLRQTFGECDVIEQVLFRAYPGRVTEYYAQIDFRSSAGVVEGHKLSGTPILGVKCQVSIVDPGSKEMMRKVWESQTKDAVPDEELRMPAMAEPVGVQLEYIRRYKALADAKRLRTVHVAGLDKTHTPEGVRRLCSKFGEVEDMRFDEDANGVPFALVEFKDHATASMCTSRQGFIVDGKTIVFTEAKTLVDMRAYAEQSVHFMAPSIVDPTNPTAILSLQSHLNPKLAKARAAAAEIMNEPVPEEVKAVAEAVAPPEEPVVWEGRSEKDFLRELALASHKPPSTRERRRSDSRKRSRRRASGSRRRRGRRRRREGDSRSGSGGRKRRRKEVTKSGKKPADAPTATGGADAVDVDDLDLAVVPNTELLVLGESSSYSSEPSPAAEVQADSNGTVVATASTLSPRAPAQAAEAGPASPAAVEAAVVETVAVAAAEPAAPAPAGILDVDEKEQWLPPVDVDEEGSCDEVVVANDDPDSPCSVVATVATADTASPGVAHEADSAPPRGQDAPLVGTAEFRPAAVCALVEAAAASDPCANITDVNQGAQHIVDRGLPLTDGCSSVNVGKATSSTQPQKRCWECASCGEPNKETRDECNNCNAAAPWVTVRSPNGEPDLVDDLSSASSPGTPSPARSVGESPPRSVANVAESPARSVVESPPRSVAASGSARSVPDSEPPAIADLSDSGSENGGIVDLAEEVEAKADDDEVAWEAERVRGEIADARARILYGAAVL